MTRTILDMIQSMFPAKTHLHLSVHPEMQVTWRCSSPNPRRLAAIDKKCFPIKEALSQRAEGWEGCMHNLCFYCFNACWCLYIIGFLDEWLWVQSLSYNMSLAQYALRRNFCFVQSYIVNQQNKRVAMVCIVYYSSHTLQHDNNEHELPFQHVCIFIHNMFSSLKLMHFFVVYFETKMGIRTVLKLHTCCIYDGNMFYPYTSHESEYTLRI